MRRLNNPVQFGELPGDWNAQMPGVAGNSPTGTSGGSYGGSVIPSQAPAGHPQGQIPGVTSAPPVTTPHGYRAALFTTVAFTADGSVPTLPLLPMRMNRRYLLIQATDPSLAIWVGFGSAPSGGVHDMKILAGDGVYEPFVVPGNALYFYGANGATAVVIEGV